MLYKKNSEKTLTDGLFENPTSEYRGTPFWAWNSFLEKEELERQIDVFREMGLGGFHMHVRTGLKNKYLSDEYMQLVNDCINKARKEKMLAWLYDEDRWPSGAAGGYVTKDEKYRARSLLFTPVRNGKAFTSDDSRSEGGRSENGKLLAVYDVVLDSDGYLASYKKINENDDADGTKWYAFLEINGASNWYNGQAYADTLNKEAIERFVEVTHEKYRKFSGDAFDETVPAIFTDEPQFSRKKVLENSTDKKDVSLPWTDKVPELYRECYGADIFETLPELFWDLPGSRPSLNRYRYHDFISELFSSSFADTVGSWCRENKIALTGHLMEEPTLHSQCAALGEAMRSYRGFDLPGIDMLCNRHEFTTAKQAQSAVHQFGYEGMLSELYGVTGWDCDFRTYKHQGDWQAALGVTVRVPHLSWYAMGGEAKRDYPASIHYQSPWYKKYSAVEDHFARVNTAMTRGKSVVKVGVIHPVESFWLHWGPNDKTAVLRESLDEKFENITKWLLEGSIDFDFISESLLPVMCEKGCAPLKVGKAEYDVIIVPGCETLRSTTVERLSAFADDGGKLVIMGSAPYLCDAVPSEKGKELSEKSINIDFTRAAVLGELEENRTLTLRYANGRLSDNLIYQLRRDNDCSWLFICFDSEPWNKDTDTGNDYNVFIRGEYKVKLYDTENGKITPLAVKYENGNTVVSRRLCGYDSLLLKLEDGKDENGELKFGKTDYVEAPVRGSVRYKLSEKNALLLDMAQFKLSGDSDWPDGKEEILRLDNICRVKCGLPERGGSIVQPWVIEDPGTVDTLSLRFTVKSEIEYNGAYLALEALSKIKSITFNGESVSTGNKGKFVDISIDTVSLPVIRRGENVLEIVYAFGEKTDIENMFILGDFGVFFREGEAVIGSLPEKISFSDLTNQGFPFYGGNVTYLFRAAAADGKLRLRASRYAGALADVRIDGTFAGNVIYPPYILEADGLTDGDHDVELTLYGHRYNAFGPVHLVNEKESWHGPGAWRSGRENWSYEYVLRRVGFLAAPVVLEK